MDATAATATTTKSGSDATTATTTTTGSSLITCQLCCEEKQQKQHFYFFSQCGHGCCKVCASRWMSKEETTGQTSPTCPFCRSKITKKEDVVAILGREFCPNMAQQSNNNAGNIDDLEMDELTRHLIEEQTTPCPSCGIRITKSEGCDLMECLCGFRFCYRCGSPGAQCNCTPSHHYYWDNIINVQAPRQAPARARINTETGQIDLAGYIRNEESRRRFVKKHRNLSMVLDRLLAQKNVDMRRCKSMAGVLDETTVISICVGRRKLAKKIYSYYYRLQTHFRQKKHRYPELRDGESLHDYVVRRFIRPHRIRNRRRFAWRHKETKKLLDELQWQRLGDLKRALDEGDDDDDDTIIFERCYKRRKTENKTFRGLLLFRRRNKGTSQVREPSGGLKRDRMFKNPEFSRKRRAAGGGVQAGSTSSKEKNWKETLSSIQFFRGLLRRPRQNETSETERDA